MEEFALSFAFKGEVARKVRKGRAARLKKAGKLLKYLNRCLWKNSQIGETTIMKKTIAKCMTIALTVGLFVNAVYSPIIAKATSSKTLIAGKVYEFTKDNDYKFSDNTTFSNSDKTTTYGQFSISGTDSTPVSCGTKEGVPSYSIKEGRIVISYTYSDALLNAADTEWHLIEDKEKNVDIYKIDQNIQKGALILQGSIDHINWSNLSVQTNAFENTPVQNASLYETQDVELINGYYYRLIVVYELSHKVGSSKNPFKDNNEYKRYAEVYEFYAKSDSEQIEELRSNTKQFRLGETKRATNFESYSEEKKLETDDLHYGWILGDFFVSGYTSNTTDNEGNPVFLKNVGDVCTLWFNLKQNINALNNYKNLSITADSDGQDQYFQTDKINFGRGMLFIRYSDDTQNRTVMYKDFLEANTSLGANTRVQLFEEGDYEVALDYEVTNDKGIDKSQHYRISFKFSVRNANCMMYLFDSKTGAELTNSSATPNGFRIDLAKSRYLNIYIEKEIWTEGADGLTKDTRSNTSAKDGDVFTAQGIYTITVENRYTGLKTTKTIYVGTDKILLAYMTSNYSLAEIQDLVSKGAVIYEDGTIEMPPETYSIIHEFVSGTNGMELPEEIRNYLPVNQGGLISGSEVTPGIVQETSIAMLDGSWTFQGWDAESKKIEDDDQTFVGTWVFEKTPDITEETETQTTQASEPETPQNDDIEKEAQTAQETSLNETNAEVIVEESSNHGGVVVGVIVVILAVVGGVYYVLKKKGKGEES